jgi:acetyl-CoA acetyltransferase
MNPDFSVTTDTRKVEGGVETLSRISYKGTTIANVVHAFTPSEKGVKAGKKPISYAGTAEEYIEKYGYLAEHRRRCNLKDFDVGTSWVSWNDSMRVQV